MLVYCPVDKQVLCGLSLVTFHDDIDRIGLIFPTVPLMVVFLEFFFAKKSEKVSRQDLVPLNPPRPMEWCR